MSEKCSRQRRSSGGKHPWPHPREYLGASAIPAARRPRSGHRGSGRPDSGRLGTARCSRARGTGRLDSLWRLQLTPPVLTER